MLKLPPSWTSALSRAGTSRLSWIAFGAAAIAALAISLAASLWIERDAQLDEAGRTADKLALALDRHAEATFDLVDGALRAAERRLERLASSGQMTDDAVKSILQSSIDGQGAIHSMSIRDPNGMLTDITLLAQPPHVDTSHSDYFRVHRNSRLAGVFVGTPIRSIVTGEWMIPISRRLNGPNGEFAGVVVATLPVSFYSDFFKSLQIGSRGILDIFRADGTTLVREPAENLIGVVVKGSPLFDKYVREAAIGRFRAVTVTDGVDRIFAYRALSHLPLVVTIGVSVDEALASWRTRVHLYVGIWLLCALVLSAFTVLMVRQAARENAAHRAAADVEQRFRRLVANVPGVVFQRVLKKNGTVAYNFISGRVQEIFGYTAEAIMQQPGIVMAQVDDAQYRVQLGASAEDLTTLTLEHQVADAWGQTRWMRTMSTPSRLANGDVIWDGVAIDITERKEIEIALKASQAEAERAHTFLTDAIESISGGFVLYDADDRLVLMNRVAREWNPEFASVAVPGSRYEDLIRAAARSGVIVGTGDSIEEMVKERLALHRKAFGRPVERRVDGRWYQVTEYPTSNGGVVVLRTDVTALKEVNVRLEEARILADQANRAKSDFLAMMSHELRTPLNAILGFAEIIRDHSTALAPAKASEYAADIHTSGTLLLTLVNDVLDLSKAEAGMMELQLAPVDVSELVGRSLRMIKERATRQAITLSGKTDGNLPPLYADDRKLMQILLNLLSNAVKFTPGGGRVTVSATCETKGVLAIRVTDTGVGIAAENLAKALSPFGQIDNLLTREHSGTGLGLPLAKRLTELHGGTFDIESRVGLGTTITLRFPVDRGIAAAA
ncbi:MAG TPA: ATP-binding protein [Alphaproteobacteria bacterium]|nr:ATP-binding protein [Alphaproteobacteria bacterium]